MSQRRKLVETILARPVQASYRDVEAVLEMFGWELKRTRGSHHVFGKPGEDPITVPTIGGRRVKGVYLDVIRERLGLDDLDLDTLED